MVHSQHAGDRMPGPHRTDDDHGLFGWFWHIWQAPLGASAIVLSASAAIAGAIIFLFPEIVGGIPWTRAKTVVTERWSRSTVVFPITGRDAAGRRARFDFIVATNDISWRRGSPFYLERDNGILYPQRVIETLFTPNLMWRLNNAADVIAVGSASEEGRPAVEKVRAAQRAESAAEWIKTATSSRKRVWELNLGQFRSGCDGALNTQDTNWQRPFVMVSVRWKDPDISMSQALKDAMRDRDNLPSPNCYTTFDLIPSRV